jgi:putative FmdB family regulatory protein
MPRYDYDCAACGRRFEVVHGVYADGPTVCPLCGSGPVRKAISAAAVHFKGSGWAKKERRAPSTSGSPKSATETAGSSTGSTGSTGSAGSTPASESGGSENPKPAPSKSAETGATSTTD